MHFCQCWRAFKERLSFGVCAATFGLFLTCIFTDVLIRQYFLNCKVFLETAVLFLMVLGISLTQMKFLLYTCYLFEAITLVKLVLFALNVQVNPLLELPVDHSSLLDIAMFALLHVVVIPCLIWVSHQMTEQKCAACSFKICDSTFVSFKCDHDLCFKCYNQNKCTTCPVCKQSLQIKFVKYAFLPQYYGCFHFVEVGEVCGECEAIKIKMQKSF